MEKWKKVKGFKKYYEVSSHGRVKSIRSDKIMKLTNSDGYLKVDLRVNGIRKNCWVHILVAEKFVKNPEKLPLVNHKDGCKSNNNNCLLYTSPSPRDKRQSRMPSSA